MPNTLPMSTGGGSDGSSRVKKHLRAAAPWLVATAILAYFATTVPLQEATDALQRVSVVPFLLLAVAYVAAQLTTDALSLWTGFRVALATESVSYRDVLVMRGASYLLTLIHFGAGQGGVAYFLHRYRGITIARAASALILTTGAFLLVIVTAAAAGLAAGAVPAYTELRIVAYGLIAAVPGYLAIIAMRPAFLTRWALLRPLFDAGVVGTLSVVCARCLHVAVLIATHFVTMRLFGIDVPISAALAGLPVVFMVGAIPVSPSGLGTSQAAAMALFASYAPGADADAQRAVVLAYSLSLQIIASTLVACIGVVSLRLLTRSKPF